MKNLHLMGAIAMLGILLSLPAQATLVGDNITGEATQGVSGNLFSPDNANVDNSTVEFAGLVDGSELSPLTGTVEDIEMYFDFVEFGGNTYLSIQFFKASTIGFELDDITVDFTSINYSLPDYILSGVVTEPDPNPDPNYLQGVTVGVGPDGTSLSLSFNDFVVNGDSRYVDLRLIFEEDDDGTTNPIPEPATLALLAMGLGGLAVRRKYS